MTIFGALASIVGSLGYAAVDEARAWYRTASYKLPETLPEDKNLYYDLKKTLEDNWRNGGATLYPQKLIPFLALNDNLRNLWTQSIVKQIIATQNKISNGFDYNPIIKDLPYGSGAQNYSGITKIIETDEEIYGPSYYEYDFVKQNYPDDWSVYTQAEIIKEEAEAERSYKESSTNKVLILIGCLLMTAVCVLFFGFIELFIGMDGLAFRILVACSLCGACAPFFIVLRRSNIPIPNAFWIGVVMIIILVFFPNICG